MRVLLALLSIVLLDSCGGTSQTLCLNGGITTVGLKITNPSALDGYEYVVCPLTNNECDGFNRLDSERPSTLQIEVVGKSIHVSQFGGSVTRFNSDPIGMRNPNYEKSATLYMNFEDGTKPTSGVIASVNGHNKAFVLCDASVS